MANTNTNTNTNNARRNAMRDQIVSEPAIGMGVTVRIGSDTYAATVIAISPSGHKITLQADKATATQRSVEARKADMGGMQDYIYTLDPNGEKENAYRGKDGKYRIKSRYNVTLGIRSYYQDPSF